jgi:hypothetical protein
VKLYDGIEDKERKLRYFVTGLIIGTLSDENSNYIIVGISRH